MNNLKSTLHFPRQIQLQTHSRCNLSCDTCPHSDQKRNKDKRLLNWKNFTKLIDECLSHEDFKEIILDLQNEPLLDNELVRRVRYIKTKSSRKIFVGMTTNGILLTKNIFLNLVDAGIDRIVVSLNAIDEKEYQLIVPHSYFGTIVNNLNDILSLESARSIIKVSFGITESNYQSLGKFIEHFEKQKLQYRFFSMNSRLGEIRKKWLVKKKDEKALCHVPLYSLAVLLDGNAIVCCQDWSKKFFLGNVIDMSVSEIWNSPFLTTVRNKFIKDSSLPHFPCSKCDSPYTIANKVGKNFFELDKTPARFFFDFSYRKSQVFDTRGFVLATDGNDYFLYNIYNKDKIIITETQAKAFEFLNSNEDEKNKLINLNHFFDNADINYIKNIVNQFDSMLSSPIKAIALPIPAEISLSEAWIPCEISEIKKNKIKIDLDRDIEKTTDQIEIKIYFIDNLVKLQGQVKIFDKKRHLFEIDDVFEKKITKALGLEGLLF